MAMLIRTATGADITALQALIPASVRSLSAGFYDARQIESALTHVFGIDSQLIADATYFVAEDDGLIVGCGGWSKRQTLFGGDQSKAERGDPLLDPATDAARIRAFFVHPTHARKGIGKRIIEACEKAARQAGFRTLELAATLPGVPFYLMLGYTTTEQFEYQLADGVPFPLARMVKHLPA